MFLMRSKKEQRTKLQDNETDIMIEKLALLNHKGHSRFGSVRLHSNH
jgi:hypothetical protein